MTARLAGAVLVAVALLGAAPALAHNALRSSTPADGDVVASPPADVRLVFDQSVVVLGTEAAVTGPGGSLDLEPPAVDGDTVTQPLPDGLPGGDYRVAWRATSADGHPISGEFGFTAEAAAPVPSPTTTEVGTPSEPPRSEPPPSAPTSEPPKETSEGDGPSGSAVAAVVAALVAISGGLAVAGRRKW